MRKIIIVAVVIVLFLLGCFAFYTTIQIKQKKSVQENNSGQQGEKVISENNAKSQNGIGEESNTEKESVDISNDEVFLALPDWVKQMGIDAPQGLTVLTLTKNKEDNMENGMKYFSVACSGEQEEVFKEADRIAGKAGLPKLLAEEQTALYANFKNFEQINPEDKSNYGILVSVTSYSTSSESVLTIVIDSVENMKQKLLSPQS
ncbi:hypothetical protein J7J13_03365 [bacterium]|nr:hypothetical protein [bacterium]